MKARARRRSLLIAAALGVLLVALPQAAQAYIYFGNHKAIGRAELDGSNVEPDFIPVSGFACGVAVDSGHIYWGDENEQTIGRASLSGDEVEPHFITAAGPVCGVAVNATGIYWTNLAGGIGHAAINGSGANALAASTTGVEPCGIAVNSDELYYGWHGNGSGVYGITRLSLEEGPFLQPLETMTTEATGMCGIALDSSWLYWANGGPSNLTGDTLGRMAPASPTPFNDSFVQTEVAPWGVAVDSSHIFWTVYQAGTIGRSDLSGANPPEQKFITGLQEPVGIAVDNGAPPAPTPPSTPTAAPPPGPTAIGSGTSSADLQIGKPLLQKKDGTATLAVTLPGPGTLLLTGKGIVKVEKKIKGKGKVKLMIEPTTKTRKTLARTGKAKVTAKITFTPTGGTPNTKSETLTLKG